mmetsp:Transcript_21769/g.24297  ORF Transcript_21769/g.24297 Transcript_21769/m.24297 type:complete len:111 (-) Transcript_21769:135-467(-)
MWCFRAKHKMRDASSGKHNMRLHSEESDYVPTEKTRITLVLTSEEMKNALSTTKNEFTFEIPDKTTSEGLKDILAERYPQLSDILANATVEVNGVESSDTLNENDKVTLS